MKIGTGIGSGFVAGGHVHRGADGGAGDIGHIHVPDHDDVVCRCGNVGCLEAIAGGGVRWPRASSLTGSRHARPGRGRAGPVASPTRSAPFARPWHHAIGGVLATCVNMLNPAVIVIGGDVVGAGELLLADPQAAYKRSLAVATGQLQIGLEQARRRSGHHGGRR